MRIRHLVTRDNVDPQSGAVINALNIRHGILVAGKVADLAGCVDPRTHLNLDFGDHFADLCTVVERFETGAPVCTTAEGFVLATVRRESYQHLGTFGQDEELLAWRKQFDSRKKEHLAHESV